MTFHLTAFGGTSTTSLGALSPFNDMYLPSTTSGYLLPSPMKVVAAYASSPGTLKSARITAPSLRRLAYPYIRPLGTTLPEGTDPNVMNLISHPLQLQASETLNVEASAATAAEVVMALVWLCEELTPVPPGEKFTLRFTATGAAGPSEGTWMPIGTLSFDQSLPQGIYTVVGFEHWNPGAVAARLVFPGMAMRPGTLSMSSGSSTIVADRRTDRIFYEGGIGVYGSFNSFAPPSLEAVGTTSDTAHEGYLTVIRTGDAGALPHAGGAAHLAGSLHLGGAMPHLR
jgi:hypothetical protein